MIGDNYVLIFGKMISFYSVLGFVGLAAALLLCIKRRKMYGVEKDDIVNLAAYSIIGIIVGSKLLALICMIPQFIEYWDRIQWNSEFIKALMQGGFVFYGGFAGVVLAFYIYCRQFKLSFSSVMELAAPAFPLFHFFGRLGCYTAGCCGGIGGFPLQLVEAFLNLAIFLVIIYIQDRNCAVKDNGGGKPLFQKTFFLYMLMYGITRFVLEFFRGDAERGFIGALSVSQWISIAVTVIAVISLFRENAKFAKKNDKNNQSRI